MRVERRVGEGEEVLNCYGDGMGDGRLLVEWGFVGDEFAGDGLLWSAAELDGETKEVWSRLMERGQITLWSMTAMEDERAEKNRERLICPTTRGMDGSMSLNQSGEISIGLFSYLYLDEGEPIKARQKMEQVEQEILSAVDEVETAWTQLHNDKHDGMVESMLSLPTSHTVQALLRLLDERCDRMQRSDLKLEELFDLRDVRPTSFTR